MTLNESHKWTLDSDSKNILLTFLNNEYILRYLTIPPENASDDVLTITKDRPSIVDTGTLEQRFHEFYLSDMSNFINWARSPDIDKFEEGRICFYPDIQGIDGHMDDGRYIIDVFIPFRWHKLDNRCFKIVREIVKLIKGTKILGDIGKVKGDRILPIFKIEGYVSYQIVLSQYNFVK